MCAAPAIHLNEEYFRERKVVLFDMTVFVKDGMVGHVLENHNPGEYVRVSRDQIGKITLRLADDEETNGYKFLDLMFEDDHRGACRAIRLGDRGFMIWDNNIRGKGFDPEVIKYTIVLQSFDNEFDTPHEDPIIIND